MSKVPHHGCCRDVDLLVGPVVVVFVVATQIVTVLLPCVTVLLPCLRGPLGHEHHGGLGLQLVLQLPDSPGVMEPVGQPLGVLRNRALGL